MALYDFEDLKKRSKELIQAILPADDKKLTDVFLSILKEINIKGENVKKIEIDLPECPSSGAFCGGPSGDNEYDEAMNKWRKQCNLKIIEAIPDGCSLKSSKIKEVKIVKHVAEITWE